MQEHATGLSLVDVIEPLYRAKFWMQLIGVLLILSGVLTALSIVGILVAWIPIWSGIALMQAASAVQRAYTTQDGREARQALVRLKTYFTIFGIVMLIYLIIMIVSLIVTGGAMLTGMGGMM